MSARSPDDQLSQWHQEASARYQSDVPPGYMDLKDKGVPAAYGDYVGWRQLMDIAVAEGKDILFVTDDLKEDWWQYERKRRIGPRPELLAEFRNGSTQRIWFYDSEGFLRAARQFDSREIEEAAILEVGARLESQTATSGNKLSVPGDENAVDKAQGLVGRQSDGPKKSPAAQRRRSEDRSEDGSKLSDPGDQDA